MPITTVTADADGHKHLKAIADDIARSKKVVFVTGAGVSTNCGIPVSLPKFMIFAVFVA